MNREPHPTPRQTIRQKGALRTRPVRTLLMAAVLGAVAIIGLLALLDVTDLFRFGHPMSSTTYASKAELVKSWDKTASWLPDDATHIQIREVNQYGPEYDPAILRAISHEALNPSLCAKTARLTHPTFTAPWSPDTDVPTVYVCGAWDVIPTANGWFGWTRNSPQEQAAANAVLADPTRAEMTDRQKSTRRDDNRGGGERPGASIRTATACARTWFMRRCGSRG